MSTNRVDSQREFNGVVLVRAASALIASIVHPGNGAYSDHWANDVVRMARRIEKYILDDDYHKSV